MWTTDPAATSRLSLPAASYVYKIVRCLDSTRVGAISSDDSIRIVEATTLQETTGGVLSKVHAGVTCLESVKDQAHVLVTAGRDATLPSQNAVSPLLRYLESHSDDITELQYHPTQPTVLLSGSTDGLLNIYDTSNADEDDALRQITNHGSSIHHAGFLNETVFCGLSHDEVFSIYPLENDAEVGPGDYEQRRPILLGDLRSKLDCEYIVDVYQHGNKTILAAGSHSSKQCLDIIPLNHSSSWSFDTDQALRLLGGHGEEIIRSVCFLDRTIFTAGEDGTIRAWSTSDAADAAKIETEDPTLRMKQRKQLRAKDTKEKVRFKPY
ncbi:MAG: hypothetical protein Q9163_001368 [Psora crenata]